MGKEAIFYKGKKKKPEEIISIEDGVWFFKDIQRAVAAYSSSEPKEVRGKGGVWYMDKFDYRAKMDEALVQTPCVLKKAGKR